MDNEYTIKSIKKLKFNKKDIFILVAWEDTVHREKPIVNDRLGTVICNNGGSWYPINHWTVKWKDSWIKITDLTSTSTLWADFYKRKVLPIVQEKGLTNDEIIISRS